MSNEEPITKRPSRRRSLVQRPIVYTLLALATIFAVVAAVAWLVSIPTFPTWLGFNGVTAWDAVTVLGLPITVFAAGALFSQRQKQAELEVANKERENDRQIAREREENDRRIAVDRDEEATLQAYLDRMSDLLLNHKLRNSQPESEERSVARSMTLTTLRRLNGERKAILIKFLYESRLVGYRERKNGQDDVTEPIIGLSSADLRKANFEGANLSGANLSFADLASANFHRATLSHSVLVQTKLTGTDLSYAGLRFTNAEGADLSGARLPFANLCDTNIEGANLSYTDLTRARLRRARLEGAVLKRANLISADFRNADLYGADLEDITRDGTNFTDANLAGTILAPEPEVLPYRGAQKITETPADPNSDEEHTPEKD